jgi:transketolase
MGEAVLNAEFSNAELESKASALRATCVQMAFDARQGHLNGALSSVDILVALYYGFLRVAPERPDDPGRDRLIFSKGHACKSLYAVLADRGFIPREWLREYATNDTRLAMHPCKHALNLLETSAGSLGHGLGMATGMAYALRLEGNPARCVAVLSDGECNEGSTWEAAMFAAAQKMDTVLAVVDYNHVQSVGRTDALTGGASFEEKFRAFGWAAKSVDGNDIGALRAVLAQVPLEKGRPTAIIAHTRAGKGVSFMEDQVLWHYRAPSQEDLARALAELGERAIFEPAGAESSAGHDGSGSHGVGAEEPAPFQAGLPAGGDARVTGGGA